MCNFKEWRFGETAGNKTNFVSVDKLQLSSNLVVLLFVTGMFHMQLQIYSLLSLASDALEGLPCVYLWITGWASKYTLYVVVICLQRVLRSGNFSAEIKKLYRLHRRRVQPPKWSVAVIWRFGTELRHFDQEIWGSNNCDMLVFTVDESRDISFFFLSVSIVHFTVNSLWQKHHLSLRFTLSRIQSNFRFERGKSILISSLFLGAQLRLKITETASFMFCDGSLLNMPLWCS